MDSFSVITINYNNAHGLKKTIESVCSQSYRDFEYIIIDGNSDDGSIEVINSFTDLPPNQFSESENQKINYWISEPDTGIYNAMNKGIDKANGEYLLFLNSGDWLKHDIFKEINWQDNHEDIIYFDMFRYYSDDKIEQEQYPEKLTLKRFIHSNIGHQASFIKKDVLLALGRFNENYIWHADYDFWLNAVIKKNCTIKHIPLFLSYYDMFGFSSNPTPENIKERNDILKKHIPQRILDDYTFWMQKDKTHAITDWYYNHRPYQILVIFYKIIKNIRKLFRANFLLFSL